VERADDRAVTLRTEVEEFLYREAELLDAWRLDEWLALLSPDAIYEVPPNDRPEASSADTLFIIADDMDRIRARVKRLQSHDAHAESPRSRTRRMIHNVMAEETGDGAIRATANFVVYRFRRNAATREYVGRYIYRLKRSDAGLRIAARRAVLDSEELGALGSVSFIL
jgi:p-cumate 2,3-dioxygenase beta subunit